MSGTDPLFVDTAGVARLLGLDTAVQFRRRRARLEAEWGFPRPLPILPARWRTATIEAWIAAVEHMAPIEPLTRADRAADCNAAAARRLILLREARH